MIRKIFLIQIVSLILCSCACFPLEEKPVSNEQEDTSLQITEVMFIKNQITDKWARPVGNIENIKVKVKIELAIDGSVTKADIISINCPAGGEQFCQLVAESTIKAVKKASPIKNLRPDRHDIWKNFDLEFDPGNY